MPKSWVWSHFHKEDDGRKFQCKLCDKKLSSTGGLTTLKYHVEKTHNLKNPDEKPKPSLKVRVPSSATTAGSSKSSEDGEEGSVDAEVDTTCRDSSGRMVKDSSVKRKGAMDIASHGQSLLTQWVNTPRPCSSHRAEEITKLVVNCVVKDLLPLSMCEGQGLRTLMLFLEPNYQPPCHKTVRAHLMRIYDVKRASLLDKIRGKEVSLTTDGWTNSQMVGFFSVMAHYVDDDWNHQCYNLDSPDIDGRHTGERLGSVLDKVVTDWEIDVFSCTHDTASNMNCALRMATTVKYDYGCLAHILQLAIKDAFDTANQGKVAAVIKKVKDVVNFAGKSENFCREMRKYRDQMLPKDVQKRELQCDVDTRWNSTVIMIESFLSLHKAVEFAVNSVCNSENKKKLSFSVSEIELLTDITELLANLRRATDQWQGQHYVTSSTVYPVIFAVIDSMKALPKMSKDAECLRKHLIKNVRERLSMDDEEFLGNMSIPMVASFLDPRFKKLSFVSVNVRENIKTLVENEILKIEISVREIQETHEPPEKKQKSFLEELLGSETEENSHDESNELQDYEKIKPAAITASPLQWWKAHQYAFPKLAKLARRYLPCPATSASSERLFSSYGLVYEDRRMTLAKETASAIVFLHENDV